MKKKIEITFTCDDVSVHIENASKDDVGLALCEGVFAVCKDLNIPISLITGTLNLTDRTLSQEKPEDTSAKDDNADDYKEISSFIDMLKRDGMSLKDVSTLATILAIHKVRNR